LAIYATYSHASPVWTGRNETHELSLMPVGEVKSGTSAKPSLHVLAKRRHSIPARASLTRSGHPPYCGETTNGVPLRAWPVEADGAELCRQPPAWKTGALQRRRWATAATFLNKPYAAA